jgi:hypothetical protein
MTTSVEMAVKAFETVSGVSKAQKAFDFIAEYKAQTGHRPSLSSIVMLWQEAQAKLAELQSDEC